MGPRMSAKIQVMQDMVKRLAPDDLGYYLTEEPYVREHYNTRNSDDMNRVFGVPLEFFVTSSSGLTFMQSNRVINSKQYRYAIGGNIMLFDGNFAGLVPDYDSAT